LLDTKREDVLIAHCEYLNSSKLRLKVERYHDKLFAKQNGYKTISLICLDTAYPAHHFYESVGFKKSTCFKYQLIVEEMDC